MVSIILYCSFQCDKKEYFIEKITKMDFEVQTQLVPYIREVSDIREERIFVEIMLFPNTYLSVIFICIVCISVPWRHKRNFSTYISLPDHFLKSSQSPLNSD